MGIELFRGLAALMVLMTHYASFVQTAPNGFGFLWTGVDLFFVISGYVFAPQLLSRMGTSTPGAVPGFPLRGFYIRRFFRIYPLYAVAVLAYALALPEAPEKLGYFWRHLAFLHTTRSFEEAYYFNPAFWSLPVEIEFYILLPLLALLGRRLWWLGVITVVIGLFAHYQRGADADLWRILSAHLPAILPEFLAGSLLSRAVQQGQAQNLGWQSGKAGAAFALGILLLGYGYLLRYGGLNLEANRLLDAPFNLVCAAGYALVMYPLLLIKEHAWTVPAVRVAKTAGALSYGVYLFHNLSPRLLQSAGVEARGWNFVLLAAALTLAFAAVLYTVYENPLRNLGRRLGKKN